jgi:deoxyribonuclease IV
MSTQKGLTDINVCVGLPGDRAARRAERRPANRTSGRARRDPGDGPRGKPINIRAYRIIVERWPGPFGERVIRFGPSGIPLSCKGRTLRDGIEDIHNLGLTAMEVQLVRVNLNERYVGEDDVGRTPREIPDELIVQVGRKEDRKEVLISALDTKIEKGDVLYSLASGIARDYHELEELGTLARELDIELTLHTPYYMDLADADGLAEKSVQSVIWGGMLAEAMHAPIVITHLGMFGDLDPKEALNRIGKNLRTIRDTYKKAKIRSRLGIEASGRTEVVGSLDELLGLVKNAKGVLPVLNFAHVHARGFGLFKRPEDFDDVLSKVEKASDGGHIHSHFSGVEHADGNELRYTPIKKGDLRFEPLAECLLDDDYDLTIVSSSPLLEHDAMYMKVILERVLAKRLVRPSKPEKPQERMEKPEKPLRDAKEGKAEKRR